MTRTRTVVIAFALSLAAAWAQEFRATLTGRVTDSSEAAVPSATLEIRNIQTNEVFRAVTGPQGDYSAPLLRPGTYSISTQVAGFKKYTRVSDAEKWLAGYSTAVHRVVFYGDHIKGIERLGRLMAFETVRAC